MQDSRLTPSRKNPVWLIIGAAYWVGGTLQYLSSTSNDKSALVLMPLLMFALGTLGAIIWAAWKRATKKARKPQFGRWLVVMLVLALALFFIGRDLMPPGSTASALMGLGFYLTMGGACIANYFASSQTPVKGN